MTSIIQNMMTANNITQWMDVNPTQISKMINDFQNQMVAMM